MLIMVASLKFEILSQSEQVAAEVSQENAFHPTSPLARAEFPVDHTLRKDPRNDLSVILQRNTTRLDRTRMIL